MPSSLLPLLLSLALAAGRPPEDLLLEPLGTLQVTYYWVAAEDERYAGLERSSALRSPDGRVLARVSAAYRRAIELEGTGRLADGRVLNASGRHDGELRFREVEHPFGLGAGSRPLEPFVSVAIDPELLEPGSWLFIEELAGFLLPDGGVHTGFVRTDDVGSAIRNRRIDIFIGEERLLPRVESAVSPSHGQVSVHLARPAGTP